MGSRHYFSTSVDMCGQNAYSVSAENKQYGFFFILLLLFHSFGRRNTEGSNIFLWDETENRALLPFFCPHMQ